VTAGDLGTVGITGTGGYLGGVIRQRLQSENWNIIDLVRTPHGSRARPFTMGGPQPADLLTGVDVLIHCAYDMTLRQPSDIREVNVEGTRKLLQLARASGVGRVVVLSSMSAYEGTQQIYGLSKLAIEDHARELGACSIRPGLVYGPRAGGMAGTLGRLARLPLVPVMAPHALQFTVHEDDLAEAVVALIGADQLPAAPIGVANPEPVPFSRILKGLARQQGRRARTVPVDWRLVLALLRAAERLNVPLPVRSDSVLGLVHPATSVPNQAVLDALGVRFRRFGQPVPPRPPVEPDNSSGDRPSTGHRGPSE
jgi:nucleoside-diphosphate-sugar epimerase